MPTAPVPALEAPVAAAVAGWGRPGGSRAVEDESKSRGFGFKSMIVLGDVRGLGAEAEAGVSRWAARALVDAILAELDQS